MGKPSALPPDLQFHEEALKAKLHCNMAGFDPSPRRSRNARFLMQLATIENGAAAMSAVKSAMKTFLVSAFNKILNGF